MFFLVFFALLFTVRWGDRYVGCDLSLEGTWFIVKFFFWNLSHLHANVFQTRLVTYLDNSQYGESTRAILMTKGACAAGNISQRRTYLSNGGLSFTAQGLRLWDKFAYLKGKMSASRCDSEGLLTVNGRYRPLWHWEWLEPFSRREALKLEISGFLWKRNRQDVQIVEGKKKQTKRENRRRVFFLFFFHYSGGAEISCFVVDKQILMSWWSCGW